MTKSLSPLLALVQVQRRRQSRALRVAALAAASVSISAIALLGLSGWFLAGAAVAGAAGPLAVQGYNYVLPSAAIRFLAIARTAARYMERVAGHEAALKALAEIRPELFRGLAAGPPEKSLAMSSGEASGRLVQDVNAIETLFIRLSAPWAAGAAICTSMLLLTLATPLAAVVFLAAFALQVAAGAILGNRISIKPGAEVLWANGQLKSAFQSIAAAAPELRCYALQDQVIAQLMTHDATLGNARIRSWLAEGLTGLIPALLSGTTAAAVLAVSTTASLPFAALAALTAVVAMEGGAGLTQMFHRDGMMRAAAQRLDEILVPSPAASMSGPPLNGSEITLSIGAHKAAVKPGQCLALTGHSGSGKTRLLEALAGLRAAPAETITIDGVPLENLNPRAALSLFALAPQDARMISGTMRENLMMGNPAANDSDIWSALEDACLATRARALPLGLDTWLGEGGARLSGGERRRLSLARACLRPARWLLLDEPTEGLDAVTEANVVAALRARLARTGQGAIIVSHRAAPLTLCSHSLSLT